MNRRETLKLLGVGAISGTALVSGCKPKEEKEVVELFKISFK